MLTVADPIRCRMLRILDRQELTVSELCGVLQLPQSTVSRHLKALQDDAWLASRRDGTSRFYRMDAADLAEDSRGLWELLQTQLTGSAPARDDDARLDGVVAARRSKSREFFATEAGRWEGLREEQFGRAFHLQAMLGLLDEAWMIADLGCGTGIVTQCLAPFVRQVVAIDGSTEMLAAARRRLEGVKNVDLRQGELERLPLRSGVLDAAVLILVLHYLADPARVLTEAARIIRPGGRLLIVDMLPHDREEYQQQMGHVWLGFSAEQVSRYLEQAGLTRARMFPLPPDSESRGPRLFVATASRPTEGNKPGKTEPEATDGHSLRFDYLETESPVPKSPVLSPQSGCPSRRTGPTGLTPTALTADR